MPPIDTKNFRDGSEPRPTDVFIAVMGVTGAGKSSLISLCSQRQVRIGHDLQACTQVVDVYACEYKSSITVFLIDTPGFDDTDRSDTDVLKEIATWLTDSYSNQIKLNGIIYLHRISDPRMQGSAKKNLLMFKKLCGKDAMKNVILATTMWDKVSAEEGAQREAQLISTANFWGWMVDNGSRVFRHDNDRPSAMKLVEYLIEKSGVTLDLQEEMVNRNKPLDQTNAGKELESELAKEREKFEKQLREVEAQMKQAQLERDAESEKALREIREENAANMRRVERDRQELQASMERLHEEKYAKLEKQLKAQQKAQDRATEAHNRELEILRQEQIKMTTLRIESPPPESDPEKDPIMDDVILALCGRNYYLNAAVYDCLHLPADCRAHEWGRCYSFAFGVSGTWIAGYEKYGTKHRAAVCSPGFEVEYPGLWEKVNGTNADFGALKYISLGPNKTYYARTMKKRFWNFPKKRRDAHDIEDERSLIKQLALGYDGAYFMIRKDESTIWNFNGHYSGLEARLQTWKAGRKVKSIALDMTSTSNYVVVHTDGSMHFKVNSDDRSAFRHFGTRNFDIDWKLRT